MTLMTTTSTTTNDQTTRHRNTSSTNNEVLHILTVDSRNGRAVTDPDCYIETTYDKSLFNVHIHDDPRSICVSSPVAQLCGLDLKIYFHHDEHHGRREEQECDHRHNHSHSIHGPGTESPVERLRIQHEQQRTNGIATLLTFDPTSGTCRHLVYSKAYVLLNDGRSPLNYSRLASVIKLIDDGWNDLYHRHSHGPHRHGRDKASSTSSSSDAVLTAHQEDLTENACVQFLQLCARYRRHHDDEGQRNHFKQSMDKHESGISDAATCNHVCNDDDDDDS